MYVSLVSPDQRMFLHKFLGKCKYFKQKLLTFTREFDIVQRQVQRDDQVFNDYCLKLYRHQYMLSISVFSIRGINFFHRHCVFSVCII